MKTLNRASDVAFSSMPTMHVNEQVGSGFDDTAVGRGRRTSLRSCSEPVTYAGSSKMCIDGCLPFHQVEGFAWKKLFAPYWPIEAVNEASEKGEAFKALFRVSAHNRFEVEGDIVVIKVDPLELWTKMKGSS